MRKNHVQKLNTDDIENDHFKIKTKAKIVKTHRYDIYISSNITNPHEYIEMLDLFMNAKADDEIHVHLNSGGGYCSTTTQLINAMLLCKAVIICYAEGIVASCATWIFLAGDNFVINEDIEFMCHYYSGGMYGKGNEIEADAEFSKKYWHKKFHKIYKHFLTDEEIKKLIDGKDYYFDKKQVVKRLKSKYTLLEQELIIDNDTCEVKTKKKKKKK